MFKTTMSISQYSIARFLNFVLENKTQNVLCHYAMKERDCQP